VSKQTYRSDIEIIGSLLKTIAYGSREGVKISKITREANLSHYATIQRCQKLADAGLIRAETSGRNKLFIMTEKGLEFFSTFDKFHDFAKKLGLCE